MEPTGEQEHRDRTGPGPRDELLVLLGLTGFAVTEPLLSVFGRSPSVFNYHDVGGAGLVAYAVGVASVPPLALWLATRLVGLGHRPAGRVVHLVAVAGLAGLAALQVAKWQLGVGRGVVLAAVAVSTGIAVALAYTRWTMVSSWLKLTAVLPALSAALFLFASETGDLLRPAATSRVATPNEGALPSVVFLLLDEFPTKSLVDESGNVDPVRFPNLAAFAREATWYRLYTTVSGLTEVAIPVVLTGKEPTFQAAVHANFPDNLFSLLAPTHRLRVFESPTELCAMPECDFRGSGTTGRARWSELFGLTASVLRQRTSLSGDRAERFDDFEERFAPSPAAGAPERQPPRGFGEAMRTAQALARPLRLAEFSATFDAAEGATLYFLHLLLPHIPFRFYEDGQPYDVPVSPPSRFLFSGNNTDGGEWVATLSEQRHLLQAEYTDRLIGDVIARLKASGLWNDALVIITADHGVSFEPGTGRRQLRAASFDATAYTPLFVKEPGQAAGRIDEANLMSYDLLPTTADILGIEIPWPVAGRSARDPALAERRQEKIYWTGRGQRITVPDGAERFPRATDRWIGAVAEQDDRLRGLHDALGLHPFLGRAPEEFALRSGGRVTVAQLARLERPVPGEPAPGIVVGNVESGPVDGTIVVAIDGEIVTGSPLFAFRGVDHTFAAMLPKEALSEQNAVRVLLARDDGLSEFAVAAD